MEPKQELLYVYGLNVEVVLSEDRSHVLREKSYRGLAASRATSSDDCNYSGDIDTLVATLARTGIKPKDLSFEPHPSLPKEEEKPYNRPPLVGHKGYVPGPGPILDIIPTKELSQIIQRTSINEQAQAKILRDLKAAYPT